MPELRRDPTTGRWVIIATERASRPSDFVKAEEAQSNIDKCPFCEGKEDKTPPEITALRCSDSKPNTPGWEVRVVPNKFPALIIEGEVERKGLGVYDLMNGVGAHEVIIESPDHYSSFESLGVEKIAKIIWSYRDRFLDLRKDPRLKYILIFKNRGKKAGASLEHPHSQLIATPVLPDVIKQELDMSLRYYQYRERCVYCDIIQQEKAEGIRLVSENDEFLAIMPFASVVPFEVSILPKEHLSDFSQIKSQGVRNLAEIIGSVFNMLEKTVPNIPYNFYIHTAPLDNLNISYYHWHIHVVPRLTELAGFEWGSGFYINPMPPEKAREYVLATGKEEK